MSFSEEQIIRYSRHILLPEVGGKGQKKLPRQSIYRGRRRIGVSGRVIFGRGGSRNHWVD